MSVAYIEQQPDWGSPVVAVMKWRTDVTRSFDATEQRARRFQAAKWSLSYTVAGLSVAQLAIRRAAFISEVGNVACLPLWPFPEPFSTDSSTQITLARLTALLGFKTGSLAYFEEPGLDSVFRLIEDIGTDSLTLGAGTVYPAVSVPSYTAAAVVYPCIWGVRTDQSQMSFERHNATSEIIAVDEL